MSCQDIETGGLWNARLIQFIVLFDHPALLYNYLKNRKRSKPIPNYELYGELLAGSLPGSVHLETIKERSSRHNWTIRRHRHRHLMQIFIFRSPGVYFHSGDVEYTSTQPMILVVPPNVAHGFIFSEDVVGDVLSIRLNEMPSWIQDSVKQFGSGIDTVYLEEHTSCFADITNLTQQLNHTYHSIGKNRIEILNSLIYLIALYLNNNQNGQSSLRHIQLERHRERKELQAEKFCELLEENFHRSWTVADYASRVGVSGPQLTRVCRTVFNAPPNAMIRQRRVLEAKRLLEYTALSLIEIADRCGFRDAAFFSRTFKSHVGIPPNKYRLTLDRHVAEPR